MVTDEQVIGQTKKWIYEVVVGCNFCPFAARVMKQQKVNYQVDRSTHSAAGVESFVQELSRLDNDINIETSFLIFPDAFESFDDYLDLVEKAERMLKKKKYEGVYQVASFHPAYLFDGAPEDDAANFTNRSPYPMLHLLREESIDQALENYKDPENIPERNIHFAREKGLAYMKMLRDTCFSD